MAGPSFRKLAENLGELSTVPSRVAKAAAADIDAMLAEEFATSTDPYGNPWPRNAPATVAKKGVDWPMVETAETSQETGARAMAGAGIEVRSTEKAGFNQFERENAPARPVLPAGTDLPQRWQEAIQQRTSEAVQKTMGKK